MCLLLPANDTPKLRIERHFHLNNGSLWNYESKSVSYTVPENKSPPRILVLHSLQLKFNANTIFHVHRTGVSPGHNHRFAPTLHLITVQPDPRLETYTSASSHNVQDSGYHAHLLISNQQSISPNA